MRNRARHRCTTPAILCEAGHEFSASSATFARPRNYKETASGSARGLRPGARSMDLYIAADIEDSVSRYQESWLRDNAKSEVEKAITAITLSPLRLLQVQVQTRYKYPWNIKKLSSTFHGRAQTFTRLLFFICRRISRFYISISRF